MVQTQAIWSKTKTGSKAGFDKLWGWADKLGAPVNKLSNKLGSEAFWPTTLDKECDKAARILRSFCKDGFYQEQETQPVDGPKQKQKVLKKIPAEVIKNAKGIAIFTTMRTGLWVSGAGGSGILVGRKEDGTWSPPSGILLHTAGLGFLVGVDIYDCVVVINTQAALDAFSKVRCTLGGEISAVAGPVGVGGVLETEVHKRQAPIFTYLKSRGFYAGVQVDGTIVIERTDENERFYNERIGVADILAGKVRHPPYEIKTLMETIKAAQGDKDVDPSLLTEEPPPGDFEVEHEKPFGIPEPEDPDPYGVLALEKEGLMIREAGTHRRPTSEQFEFNPSPNSPIFTTFRKSFDVRSLDSSSPSRNSFRRSQDVQSIDQTLSARTSMMSMTGRNYVTMDTATQTDLDGPADKRSRSNTVGSVKMSDIPENTTTDEVEKKTEDDTETFDKTKDESKVFERQTEDDVKESTNEEAEEDLDDIEEPVVQEIQQAAAPQFINRARLVTVVKPAPPKLPPRNPNRNFAHPDNETETRDQGTGTSSISSGRPSPSSLTNDDSSMKSQDSFSSAEGLDHVGERLQPKPETTSQEQTSEESNLQTPVKQEEKEDFHSVPDSPIKEIPGGFH